MPRLTLLLVSLATIAGLALAVFGLVQSPAEEGGGDVIVIKGGSLEVQCGKNHGNDCLGTADKKTGKYKAKNADAHITNITIRNIANPKEVFFSSDFDPPNPPQMELTYTDRAGKVSTGSLPANLLGYEGVGDIMILKGGSLEVQCGKNHGNECLGVPDKKTGKYKSTRVDAHITNITVRNIANPKQVFYTSDFDPSNPPQIEITYKGPNAKPSPSPQPVMANRPAVILGAPIVPPPVVPRIPRTDYDTDQFSTFDGLSRVDQEKLLTERGPRLPKEYDASDLDMRVFVQGGASLVINYELYSDVAAELSISVKGIEPYFVSLEPANKLTPRTIMLPDRFGEEPQVGKLHISAVTSRHQPATLRLFEIAMGQIGLQTLNKLNSPPPYAELAITGISFGPTNGYERLPLFALGPPQASSLIEIIVSSPAIIRAGQEPKQQISFSFIPRSLFDNGRWELLAVNGLNETHVWKKPTGPIRPGKTLSEKWDGNITSRGIVSPGDHSLKITAWRGDASRGFVIARAPANLVVIK